MERTIQQDLERAFSQPEFILPDHPVVVNSKFILQVHFGLKDLKKRKPAHQAHLGIFAPYQMPIQRTNAVSKETPASRSQTEHKVTFLSIGLHGVADEVIIGEIKISLIERGFDRFKVQVESPTPVNLQTLDHDINVVNKTEAEGILEPEKYAPATKGEIQRRIKFQIQRALKNYQMGQLSAAEKRYLRKKGLIQD